MWTKGRHSPLFAGNQIEILILAFTPFPSRSATLFSSVLWCGFLAVSTTSVLALALIKLISFIDTFFPALRLHR